MAMPKAQRKQLQLEEGSNCPWMASDMSEAGRVLWKGLEGLCNLNWTEVTAGSKSMAPKKLTAAVKTYVPLHFAVNYHRFWLFNALFFKAFLFWFVVSLVHFCHMETSEWPLHSEVTFRMVGYEGPS